MTRLAWFSPMAPVRSGISRYSAEVLPELARATPPATKDEGASTIDVFDLTRAHEFVWRHFTDPYDLTVYQLGNARCHEYMWPYLVRYPGLTVLHDAQLHQSRAAALLSQQSRGDDYRAEFVANHPEANPAMAELVIHGLAGELLHLWPLVRTVVTSARTVAVHSDLLAEDLQERFPTASIETIPMGVPAHRPTASARDTRARHGIAAEAIVFAAFGRITPEKRIGPALQALAALAAELPHVRLMLVGESAPYYDVLAEARGRGVIDRVVVTGYVDETALADYVEAADVCLCLRWPTNRETSASWLRCLAAAKPTIITDLVHTAHVPAIDPRTWAPVPDAHGTPPIAVSIDVLDEDHSLVLAMRRLATDRLLGRELGTRARVHWQAHHTLDRMTEAYRRVIASALAHPVPHVDLPRHLTADGTELADRIAAEFAVAVDFLRDE